METEYFSNIPQGMFDAKETFLTSMKQSCTVITCDLVTFFEVFVANEGFLMNRTVALVLMNPSYNLRSK